MSRRSASAVRTAHPAPTARIRTRYARIHAVDGRCDRRGGEHPGAAAAGGVPHAPHRPVSVHSCSGARLGASGCH
jgi:hypothetical protein